MIQAADINVEIVFKVLMKSEDCWRENDGMRLERERLGSQDSCANYFVAFVNNSLSPHPEKALELHWPAYLSI